MASRQISDTELIHLIALRETAGIGDAIAKKLIDQLGSAEAVFSESKKTLETLPGVPKKVVNSLAEKKGFARAEQELSFIEKNSISVLTFQDDDYPQRLRHCKDSPLYLFGKGNFSLNLPKVLSIVGTRNATSYGKGFLKELLSSFRGDKDLLIVSGLAYGIDIAAHECAIENQLQTVAVLGHGLDQVYPSVHTATSRKMQEYGGLLSDYLSKTYPDRENFPKRNRIVAGMADATFVVETKIKGGSMITAEIAYSYNRDVLALPGRYNEATSAGCNLLIKSMKAVMVEHPKDLEYSLGWKVQSKKKPVQKKLMIALTDSQQALVDILQEKGKISADELCGILQKPISAVASELFTLELEGVVKALPGKQFSLA